MGEIFLLILKGTPIFFYNYLKRSLNTQIFNSYVLFFMQGGLFAKKVGMTQIFDKSGNILPVTISKVGSCKVSQIKTVVSDGYNSIQVAYENQKLEKLNRPIRGHLKKVGGCLGFRSFGEFHVSEPQNFKLGEILQADTFLVGQKVRVTGRVRGKGFSGNQKRHNFSRGPMTHGSKNP